MDGKSIPNKNLLDGEVVGLLNVRLMRVECIIMTYFCLRKNSDLGQAKRTYPKEF